MEGILTIIGLCLVFLPVVLYCNYLLKHVVKKTKFDQHIEMMNNNKLFIVIAYLERILFGIFISSFGFWMSEIFSNSVVFVIVILSFVFYVIVKYFDMKNG